MVSLRPTTDENDMHNIIKEVIYGYISENTIPEQRSDEALHTYPTDSVIRHLLGTFHLAKGQRKYFRDTEFYQGYVEKRKNHNHCDVILLVIPKDSYDLLKSIALSMEKSCGWFLACQLKINVQNMEAWQFEKKQDNDVTSEVHQSQYLFHYAPTSRIQKILHVGLVPQRTTWNAFVLDDKHTFEDDRGQHYGWKTVQRVYAFVDKPQDSFEKMNFSQEKDVFTDSYTLLRIDISKIRNDMKFYSDPRAVNAVYSLENIPPSAIECI